MIPEKKEQYKTFGNISGKKIGLTLDENATQHLVGVLTDLYEDPEKAIVREYATNARDSHIQAGVNRPIEITLPSALNPILRIQDYGLGLDEEDLELIYTKYGASTKRETNDATGMLGLGCKSALAYSDSFSIVAIKDGIKIQGTVAKNDDGVGELTIARRTETDEHNGVTIKIPFMGDSSALKEKAESLFRYWPPNSVLVNDKEPEKVSGIKFGEFILEKDETLRWYRNSTDENDVIVMGGVPYPTRLVPQDFPNQIRVIAFVEMGAVHFTPSREGLIDTPKTEETIKRLKEELPVRFGNFLNNEFSGARTEQEFLRLTDKYSEFLLSKTNFQSNACATSGTKTFENLRFRGLAVPEWFDVGRKPNGDPRKIRTVKGNPHYGYANKAEEHYRMHISEWNNVIWIEEFDVKFSSPHRARMLQASEALDITQGKAEFALLSGTLPDWAKRWIRPDRIISWADLKEVTKTPKKSSGESDMYDFNENGLITKAGISATDLAKAKTVVYFPGLRYSYGSLIDKSTIDLNRKIIHDYNPKAVIVYVPANRQDKFKRLVPNALPGRKVLDKAWEAWKNSLTPDDMVVLTGQNQIIASGINCMVRYNVKVKDLKDKTLREVIKKAQKMRNPDPVDKKKKDEYTRFRKIGKDIVSSDWKEIEEITERYPLLLDTSSYSNITDDLKIYTNAKYEKLVKEGVV